METKITSVNITSFRGLRHLEIMNLGDVNIITGDNNSGKTSFLEAIMMLASPNSLSNIVFTSRLRELGKVPQLLSRSRLMTFSAFSYLFDIRKDDSLIELSGDYGSNKIKLKIEGSFEKVLIDEFMINDLIAKSKYSPSKTRELENLEEEIESFIGTHSFSYLEKSNSYFEKNIELNKFNIDYIPRRRKEINNYFQFTFLSSIDHIIKDSINSLIKNIEYKEEVIKILSIFDNTIKDLIIVNSDDRYLHCIVDINDKILPLSFYGDGIKKVISLAAGILLSKNGVLLVDEIETSIHKKTMARVFNWLIDTCSKFSVQLFISTHSIEAVDQFLQCNPKAIKNDQIRVVTLKKNEDNTVARVLTGQEAINLRENFDMELRG